MPVENHFDQQLHGMVEIAKPHSQKMNLSHGDQVNFYLTFGKLFVRNTDTKSKKPSRVGHGAQKAPREKVLNSTEDLQAFVEFCRRPEYVNHPYSSKWCALLDRDQPVVRDLGKNFQILRECEIRRTNEHQSHLGKNVGEVTYNLGPMKSEQAFAVASSR